MKSRMSRQRPVHRRLLLTTALLGALVPALGSCAAKRSVTVRELIIRGEFERAMELSGEQLERSPESEEARLLHDQAKAAYLLDVGRELSFEGRHKDAVRAFSEAHQLLPDAPQTVQWLEKSRIDLAMDHYIVARDLHAEDKLIEAMEEYQRALEYDSELELARFGLSQVFLQLNYRDDLAEDYYNDGVRNLRQDELEIARSRFDYTTKYRERDQRAIRRREQVMASLGRERISTARDLEQQKLYAAAAKEYSVALTYAPGDEDAIAGMERCKIEASAQALDVLATQMILRQEWQEARDRLGEAEELSQLNKGTYAARLVEVEEARLEAAYELALDLEYDFRFPEAIAAFEEILAERDYFLDVRSRADTLREYIDRAEKLYSDAAATDVPGEKLFFLLQIELFWPEYLDLPEQLDALAGVEPILPGEDEESPVDDTPAGDDDPAAPGDPAASGDAGSAGEPAGDGDGGRR